MNTSLFCRSCNRKYGSASLLCRCDCGGLLDVDFVAEFPLEKIKKSSPSLWRYESAIPVSSKYKISFGEGYTSLEQNELFGIKFHIKHDYLFPTASFKDRGASVLISKLNELGVSSIIEDSSGNAASSIAAYAAKSAIACKIFVPEKTSKEKIRQIESYGADLELVKGSRQEVADYTLCKAESIYYASHSWNPYFFQGVKTIAYEIVEQLNWVAPDTVILPLGNGTLLIGAYIGFNDLLIAGLIDKMPKLLAVQAEKCAPIYHYLKKSTFPKMAKTIAAGIAVEKPVRFEQIIEAILKTEGDIFKVSEEDIKHALKFIQRKGYYIEPTSAVVVAAISQIQKSNLLGQNNVLVFTGHGLKYSG